MADDGKIRFVTDAFSEEEANVIAFGVDTPQSLRQESQMVEPFDITEKRNSLEHARIFDAGEIKMRDVEDKTSDILKHGKMPLILGKEHTLTLYAMKAMPDGTKIIVFDAHADLKDEYEGSKESHACWLRRWCEISKENVGNVMLIGVRSGDQDELEFLVKNGIAYATAEDVHLDMPEIAEKVRGFIKGTDAYVSVDMDVFDPSIAPAVKYPEPDGLSYNEFLTLFNEIGESAGMMKGMDNVEIRPITENVVTEHLAINIIFKMLSTTVH